MSKSETTDRHANARDRKRANAKKMVVTNRSIFTIQAVIGAKAAEAAAHLAAKARSSQSRRVT